MGIYDREYYRDETRGSGWFSGVAPACKTIIAINVAMFVLQWLMRKPPSPLFLEVLPASSDAIFKGLKLWQLLTATFLHQGFLHIVWNMLFLWVVGREIESLYGSREFTLLYVTAAIFSTLCWAAVDQLMPTNAHTQMVGASGTVMALVVIYVLYYPRREVLLFFILPIETWLLLIIYLGFQALMLMIQLRETTEAAAGPAFAAHLGGALYGYLYKTFDLRFSRWFQRRHRPRLRIVSPEIRERDRATTLPTSSARSVTVGGPRPSSATFFPEEQLDARLDEVLAKIAREGRGGLTDEDNHILQEASRRARDRRSDRV